MDFVNISFHKNACSISHVQIQNNVSWALRCMAGQTCFCTCFQQPLNPPTLCQPVCSMQLLIGSPGCPFGSPVWGCLVDKQHFYRQAIKLWVYVCTCVCGLLAVHNVCVLCVFCWAWFMQPESKMYCLFGWLLLCDVCCQVLQLQMVHGLLLLLLVGFIVPGCTAVGYVC